jgi:hypothetical protein
MNHTTLTVTVFSFLVGTLVFAIWSNTHVFAQQLPSSSAASPAAGNRSGSGSSPSIAISPELKVKMCDPSNPSLKVVNTTESRICGIPKTIKPSLLSQSTTATTPTSAAVSSSSPPSPQTTTTTKSTTSATNAATRPPKQQQIAATNKNNTNASSRPINSTAGATLAPVSSNKSLSSTSPSAIAPQVKAINQQEHKQPLTRINATTTGINSTAPQVKAANEQQQQPPVPSPVTVINGTDRQNYAFAATPPVVSSGKLLYLGYHDGDTNPTNGDSSQKEKSSSDSKPPTPHIKITAPDNDSISRKTTSSTTKLTRSDTTTTNDYIGPKEKSEPGTKPSNPPPYIKITAPDNDASSKKSDKKTTSSAKLDRADSTSDDDDDAKPFIDLITGSISDSGSIEKEKTSSAKLDRAESTNDDSSQKEKSNSDTKLPTPRIRITAPDNDSIEKKEKEKTSSAKLDRADSMKDESSFKKDKSSSFDSRSSRHTNAGSESSSSSSDLASSIMNEEPNSPGEARHNLFGFSDHGF